MLSQRYMTVIMLFIFVLALVISAGIGINRLAQERESRHIEIILNYSSFYEMCEKYDLCPRDTLDIFKQAGVTSLAFEEQTLPSLEKQGMVSVYSREELQKKYYLTGDTALEKHLEKFRSWQAATFLIFEDKEMFNRVSDHLSVKLPHRQESYSEGDYDVYVVEASTGLLKMVPLGFNREEMVESHPKGFNLIPRVENWSLIPGKEKVVEKNLQILKELPGVSTVIFGGSEVLGYPYHLELCAEVLRDESISFGLIEFFPQEGAEKLASLIDFNVLKVHSISEEEMEILSMSEAVARWERAAKERNQHMFYLRPFKADSGENFLKVNEEYLGEIMGQLSRLGYSFGEARNVSDIQVSSLGLLFLSMGIAAAVLWFWQKIFGNFSFWKGLLLLTAFFVLSVLALYIGPLYWRMLVAFMGAVIFPVIGVYLFSKRVFSPKWRAVPGFLIISLISLAGGLIVSAVLTDPIFISKLALFRGVKAAHIIPLILLGFLLYKEKATSSSHLEWQDIALTFKKCWSLIIIFKYVLLGFVLLGVAFIYLTRTGSDSLVPVMRGEHMIREWLEYYLIARPRSKEFLFGHPLLLLGLSRHVDRGGKKLFLLLGAVGQISIVNTFCHPGNPLEISILRVFNGLLFGSIAGLILIVIYSFISRRIGAYLENED